MKFKPLLGISLITLSFYSVSCDKKDDNNNGNVYTISATMTGAKEVPANATTGTGTLTGTYDANSNTINYNVQWSGLTGNATLAHFHGPAAPTANASPVVNFTISGTSATGTAQLTDAQEQDLLNGLWYVNVHTAANSGGEIRGQVTATK